MGKVSHKKRKSVKRCGEVLSLPFGRPWTVVVFPCWSLRRLLVAVDRWPRLVVPALVAPGNSVVSSTFSLAFVSLVCKGHRPKNRQRFRYSLVLETGGLEAFRLPLFSLCLPRYGSQTESPPRLVKLRRRSSTPRGSSCELTAFRTTLEQCETTGDLTTGRPCGEHVGPEKGHELGMRETGVGIFSRHPMSKKGFRACLWLSHWVGLRAPGSVFVALVVVAWLLLTAGGASLFFSPKKGRRPRNRPPQTGTIPTTGNQSGTPHGSGEPLQQVHPEALESTWHSMVGMVGIGDFSQLSFCQFRRFQGVLFESLPTFALTSHIFGALVRRARREPLSPLLWVTSVAVRSLHPVCCPSLGRCFGRNLRQSCASLNGGVIGDWEPADT